MGRPTRRFRLSICLPDFVRMRALNPNFRARLIKLRLLG